MAIFNTVPPLQAGKGIKFDGLTISTAAAHRNLLDNSDFTNLVAQAGIGGNHGTIAYAADRWILDSGTVSYAAGVGLTLNGTIRQKLEYPPTGETSAFVGMASGAASISYADGAVTITSSGGVLKWAALYGGVYSAATMPDYQPKGYAAELNECMQYYQECGAGLTFLWDNNMLWSTFFLASKMRVAPSIVLKKTDTPVFSYGGETRGNLNVSNCVLKTSTVTESAVAAIVITGTPSQTISKGMYRYNDIAPLVAFSADL